MYCQFSQDEESDVEVKVDGIVAHKCKQLLDI